MKISSISNFRPSFGHISKQAVDAVRAHAEGYRINNETGQTYYSTDTKYELMQSQNLKRLNNLTKRASLLDNSWIDSDSDGSLVIEFYKNCNPSQVCRFNHKKEGNISAALDVLEGAIYLAEGAEGVEANENEALSPIWRQDINNVTFSPERFRSSDDNQILKNIYAKTFDLKA